MSLLYGMSQTISGVTLADTSTKDFASAVEFSIITALGSSVHTVTDVTVSTTLNSSSSSSTRRLLADIMLMYTITVSDGMTADSAGVKLEESVMNGKYLMLLKESSGLGIVSVTGLTVQDISPTASPSSSPTTYSHPPNHSGNTA